MEPCDLRVLSQGLEEAVPQPVALVMLLSLAWTSLEGSAVPLR